MLKTALLSTLLVAAVTSPALSADTSTPGTNAPNAVSAPKPAPGLTEEQARVHLARQGYVNISNLARNSSGAWQGTAEKSGKQLIVSVRF